ncbi:MAG: glycoside hydrolase family 3 C-terminal domain-containing protein [Clostridiales bacterium]|nr:glycoside hydrolase family 3 C-terminal domain-containing protein [Clostridiales bacterium]
MDAEILDIEKTLQYLTLDEKLRMLSGDGMWHTFGTGELPRVRMSDGPNGLRMTDGASTSAVPSVCYPTPGMLANSWDEALVYSVGAAMGREATALGVNLLLAPGVNIKRTPLGGRNFEYYSEDPYLSGMLGKAFISGVQSTGVGACLKHFAVNNTEAMRMYANAVVDRRALFELYLKPFEIALKAKPSAVMCAYNKVNGEYCSQNEYLLKTVLRKAFSYEGLTVSDWGAVHDRTAALKAGLDLEMPDSLGMSEQSLREAVKRGDITEAMIDDSLRRELDLIDNVYLEPFGDYDADAHDRLSYNAAVESIVLLKNDNNFLPLTKDMRVAVMGSLAEDAPIEGGGSSHVVPTKTITALDAYAMRAIEISYFRGYAEGNKKLNAALYDEAMTGAMGADAVIVYAGAAEPSEGVDRKTLSLPPEQDNLIMGLTNAGHRVIVVLTTPGPVLMPWVKRARAVVYAGLNGQNGALAAVDVLYGRVNPRGKLAETFPADESEIPVDPNPLRMLYRESIFVGYRYYEAIERRVLFPFGHGLSFADVKYDGMKVKRLSGTEFEVTVDLSNDSVRDAFEIVQVYVSNRTGRIMCPKKQLAGFKKVFIEGKTHTQATIKLDASAFGFYDTKTDKTRICDGEFKILVGASSADIKREISVKIDGDFKDVVKPPESYKIPLRANITDDDFSALYGGELPPEPARPQKGEYSMNSCVDDLKHTLVGKFAVLAVKSRAKKAGAPGSPRYEALLNNAMFTPLHAVVAMSDGAFGENLARGMIEMGNGKFFKGLRTIISKKR